MPAGTADKIKMVFVITSNRRGGGVATEAWWFPYTPTTQGTVNAIALADKIATLRANMLGYGAQVAFVRMSTYDSNLQRVATLPPLAKNGFGWFNPYGMEPTEDRTEEKNLTVAAGRSGGAAITFAFTPTAGTAIVKSRSTLPFCPFWATEDQPKGYPIQLAPSAKGVAKFNNGALAWTDALTANGASRYVRASYPKPTDASYCPIVGGISGTPTTLGQVFFINNNNITNGAVVHIGGRLGRPGYHARKEREFNGDRTLQLVTPPTTGQPYSIGTVTCTINTEFQACRRGGFLAPIQRTKLNLADITITKRFKVRRANKASNVNLEVAP
jgi:hypothetical protein